MYISTVRTLISPAELDSILRISRRNNAADAVTGLLVTGGTRFLQVLEGERESVMRTFDRIAADPRHFAIVRLADQPISVRAFPAWRMGHTVGGDGTSLSTIIAAIADPSLRAYFAGFSEIHAAA
ncbi:MAG: BLUF domain-containing protein [Pseudomonadota bacterium]